MGAEKLEIRGNWMIDEDSGGPDAMLPCDRLEDNCFYDLTILDKTFELNYAIYGTSHSVGQPSVTGIYPDMVSKSIKVHLDSQAQGGVFSIDLPPDLISSNGDERRYSTYKDFIVTGEHKNIIKADSRIVEAKFEQYQQIIEIGGDYLYRSNEEALYSPDFPCASVFCTVTVSGTGSVNYDVSYHLTGTVVTGFPDEIKINTVSIDSARRMLVADITAKQAGRIELILDNELLENELAGDIGVNYYAYVEGRQAEANYTSPFIPNRPRVVTLELQKGDERIVVLGMPMQHYPCENLSQLCLLQVQIDGREQPIVFSFSGGTKLASQNALSLDQILQSHAGHIHLPVPSSQPVFTIDRVAMGTAPPVLILDVKAARDGLLLVYPSREVVQGNITGIKVDGRQVEYASYNHGNGMGVGIPVIVDSKQITLELSFASPFISESPQGQQPLQEEGQQVQVPVAPDVSISEIQTVEVIATPPQSTLVPWIFWSPLILIGGIAAVIIVKSKTSHSRTGVLVREIKRMLPAAIGIEILCTASAEAGSIIGIVLFGFTTMGFIASFLLAYGVAGCTAFISILGRARSHRQSRSMNEVMKCGCDDILAHGSDLGFKAGLVSTFTYFRSGMVELKRLRRVRNSRRIIKTALFILVTAESACIVTTAAVDFMLYRYSIFLSIPLAMLCGSLVVAFIAALKSMRSAMAQEMSEDRAFSDPWNAQ
jgi:hypothetical protein